MSLNAVRNTVARYLSAAAIPGLNKVYRALPWYIDGDLFDLGMNMGSGAIAYIHMTESTEDRLSLPAVLGDSAVHYDVAIIVFYQYLIPSADIDPTLTEDEWVDGLDVMLQQIKDIIHRDPSLGAPELIFLAAQTPRTLRISSDMPRQAAGKVVSTHAIEFSITEIIQA